MKVKEIGIVGGSQATGSGQVTVPIIVSVVDVRGRVREVADGSRPYIGNISGNQHDNPAVAYTIVLEISQDDVILGAAHVRVLARQFGSLQPLPEATRERLLSMANSCIGDDWFFNTVLSGGAQTFGLSFSSALSVSNEPYVYYVGQKTRVSLGTWPGPFDLNVDYFTANFPGNGGKDHVWGRVVAVSEYFDVAQSWVIVEDTYGVGKHPAYSSILLLQRDSPNNVGKVLEAVPTERLNRAVAMACANAEGRYRVGPNVRGEILFGQLGFSRLSYIGHSGSRYTYQTRDDPGD